MSGKTESTGKQFCFSTWFLQRASSSSIFKLVLLS